MTAKNLDENAGDVLSFAGDNVIMNIEKEPSEDGWPLGFSDSNRDLWLGAVTFYFQDGNRSQGPSAQG